MSDIVTIENFLQCHDIAKSLSLTIDIQDGYFRVTNSKGETVVKKPACTALKNYLEGYRDGKS